MSSHQREPVVSRLIGLNVQWPVPPSEDGSCGACGGAELPVDACCLWCPGRTLLVGPEDRGRGEWWNSEAALAHPSKRGARAAVKKPGPPEPGRPSIFHAPVEYDKPDAVPIKR